jgi:two-component system chemotaxis response regulator CheV
VNPGVADQFKVEADLSRDIKNNLGDPDEYKILVAEDSPLIRKLIQDVLVSGGFHNVELVGHGKAAWDRLVEDGDDFDILLTDIEMPKMDGLTLTRKVKEDSALSHIPVVVFSSVMAEDIKRKAQSVGADAQVVKPEMHHLLETVIELLSKTPKAARQLAAS